MLVDSHCHLDAKYFPPDGPTGGADAVLERATAAGVKGFVVVGVGGDLSTARRAVEIAHERPASIAAAVGVHPHDASTLDDAAYAELDVLARDPAVVAVGEIGLDYHYDHSPRDVQRAAFARLIGLARAVGKPIVVHTRSAAEETLAILEAEDARDVGGVIHCFSEDRPFATRALALGFYLSFSGIVTFKTTAAIQDVAGWAPDDRILVETDSPYLSPVPLRGRPCEPAYGVHTARRVAELRKMSFERVAELTSANAERLFKRTFGA
ncbi:MAG: putative deoxyribonuclease YcfH [Myxococcaceae bacterium]|nr:putative deoxyribonuclease YcfH [Myxococcaceae bacterium]